MLELATTENRNNPYAQNEKAALECAAAGLPVLPVKVTKKPNGKKLAKPYVKWKAAATTDRAQIKSWWGQWPDAVPGAATGAVFVLDLDEDPEKGPPGELAYRDLGLDLEDADFIVRTPSGGRHLYFNRAEGLTITQGDSGLATNIDTRGEGGFVFAPGAISVLGEYRIEKGNLADIQFGILSNVPEKISKTLTKKDSPNADRPTAGGEDIGFLKDALHFIPNDGTYDEWTRILMALHHGTDGSAHGGAIAHGWSAGYPGYDPKEVDLKWRSFGNRQGDLVTSETLFAEARANGWRGFSDDDLDDLPDSPEDDLAPVSDPQIDALIGEALPPTVNKDGLTFLRPRDCMTNGRPYLVKGLIGKGDVGCVIGAPGVGKSVFAPDLAYAVAQGREFHGRRVKQGKVFYVAAEDTHGM